MSDAEQLRVLIRLSAEVTMWQSALSGGNSAWPLAGGARRGRPMYRRCLHRDCHLQGSWNRVRVSPRVSSHFTASGSRVSEHRDRSEATRAVRRISESWRPPVGGWDPSGPPRTRPPVVRMRARWAVGSTPRPLSHLMGAQRRPRGADGLGTNCTITLGAT